MVVDQNKAHQRVLYEKFLKQFTIKTSVSQQLLFPSELSFSKPEIEIIKELKPDLEEAGFVFRELGPEQVVLTGIPSGIPESEIRPVFEQLISTWNIKIPEQNFSVADLMAKSMARSLAIKSGTELKQSEQMHLVDSLFACKESELSPTGQRVYYMMEPNDIEKKFK